jgi:hypothetical protein
MVMHGAKPPGSHVIDFIPPSQREKPSRGGTPTTLSRTSTPIPDISNLEAPNDQLPTPPNHSSDHCQRSSKLCGGKSTRFSSSASDSPGKSHHNASGSGSHRPTSRSPNGWKDGTASPNLNVGQPCATIRLSTYSQPQKAGTPEITSLHPPHSRGPHLWPHLTLHASSRPLPFPRTPLRQPI